MSPQSLDLVKALLDCLVFATLVKSDLLEASFKAIKIPSEFWQPISSPGNGLLSQKKTCPTACLVHGQECMGYAVSVEDGSCTMGKVESTYDLIPEYIWNGTRVYLRSELLQRKAVMGVTHVASLPPENIETMPFENSTFRPIPFPTPFGDEGWGNDLVMANYKNGILFCGNAERICRHWRFSQGIWNDLPGQMIYEHTWTSGTLLGDKAYVFGGFLDGGKNAEVYDIKRGTWEALPQLPYSGVVDQITVVAISDNEIMLNQGRYNGGYYKDTYVFNTDTKTYQFTGYLESGDANAGMRWVGCTLKPEDQNVVMCAGGSNDYGSTNRVQFFNVAAKTWEAYQSSEDLPYASAGGMTTLGNRIFFFSGTEILEYKEGEATRWVPLPGGTNVASYKPIFYSMDYTKLLLP